tara:strand:+ start:53607 stop:53876 length:270 start_codon:yes stop_codon:yes gene_type:complete
MSVYTDVQTVYLQFLVDNDQSQPRVIEVGSQVLEDWYSFYKAKDTDAQGTPASANAYFQSNCVLQIPALSGVRLRLSETLPSSGIECRF